MPGYVLRRYRCAKPILLYGRILSTGEFIRMPPDDAAEHVASGHLVEIQTINGDFIKSDLAVGVNSPRPLTTVRAREA